MRASTLQWMFLPCALAILAGCPKPVEPVEQKTPRIVSFIATPNALPEGGEVTLTWETVDAKSVEIVDSSRGVMAGAESPTGQITVNVEKTTLFVLTARGDSDLSDTAVAQVAAGPGDSEVVLVVQPSVVAKGEPVTLAWATTQSSGVRLAVKGGDALDTEGQAGSGALTLYPETDTTYVLEAHGRTVEASVRIRPEVLRFEATPKSIEPGQPVVFSWATSVAEKVTIEEVEGEQFFTTSAAAEVAEGTFSLPIPENTSRDRVFNFRLVAEGGTSGVVAEKTLTLYVAGASRVLSFDLPRYARAGQTFTAKWTTAEADKVELFADGELVHVTQDLESAASGSTVIATPSTETEYVLRATHRRGGLATETRLVAPTVTTHLNTAAATPAAITTGGEPVRVSWDIDGARRVRIVHSVDGLVFSGTGAQLEDAFVDLYPNATGEYVLHADNTLGDVVSVKLPVTVAQPATFGVLPAGTILPGESVTVSSPLASATEVVGFPHEDVDVTNDAAAFIDIRGTGTSAPWSVAADSSNLQVSTDFETRLYGERAFGRFFAFLDGVVVLQPLANTTKGTNQPIPGDTHEPLLIAPFWDDLTFGPGSALTWQILGEAPERTLIVQWDNLRVKGEAGSLLTFQAQITQQGVVRFVYRTMNTTTATPTIGVQGPVATRGVSFPNAVTSDQTLTFFGPRDAGITFTPTLKGPFDGFVKVGGNYLRVPLMLDGWLAPNELYVSEAMPAPNATLGVDGEWVEITNLGRNPVDLDGWLLETDAGAHTISTTNGTTVVPAGGTLLMAASGNATLNGGLTPDYVYGNALPMGDLAAFVSITRGGHGSTLSWASPVIGASVVQDPAPYLQSIDAEGTAPHGLGCNGTKAYGDPLLAQTGTPGKRAGCFGYTLVPRPVSYRDISSTGTQVLLNSGTSTKVSIAAAPVPVFGSPVGAFTVSKYGYVDFTAPSSAAFNDWVSIPKTATPNNIAALFGIEYGSWAEVPGAGAYVERLEAGQDPQNPAPHWIVQWHHLRDYSLDDFNFQLKLFDDGTLEYHYGQMVSGDDDFNALGTYAVAWLENPAGETAQVISARKPMIRPFTAFRFIPD